MDLPEEQPEVTNEAVSAVLGMMKEQSTVKSNARVVDESIQTYQDLLKALKEGRIPGSALIEWADEKGKLRANVIEFLMDEKIKASDPDTGESLFVNPEKIPDHTWRVLY